MIRQACVRFAAVAIGAALGGVAMGAPVAFVIDSAHSFPRFSYDHFGLSTQISRFNGTTGRIVLDTEAKTGSVEVIIDTKSVDTGNSVFNSDIQEEEFLDTEKYPTATFKSSKVNYEGDRPVSVEGNLTIKGVTRPVTLNVSFYRRMPHPMLKKEAIGANATARISRTAFGAGKYAPSVGDEVSIDISVEAIKE
jgi:polyisoprenoid-binding protein YceI